MPQFGQSGKGGTSFKASPVAPLQKNQDDPENLKRAIDKRAKKIPVGRVVATRAPKARAFASRTSSRPGR